MDLMYRSSAVFRRLCQDYVACADSLAHWQHAATEKASLHAAEYSELLEELTTEIERALLAHGP